MDSGRLILDSSSSHGRHMLSWRFLHPSFQRYPFLFRTIDFPWFNFGIFLLYAGIHVDLGLGSDEGAKSMLSLEEGVNKRRPRPFFTTTEELLDEESYDGQLLDKKRRLTPEQVHLLERSFEAENKLEPERKSELAKKLGLQPRQVAVWFQNRRARWKTKQLERDYDRLKASYDALLADHEALLKDNDSLRSQVICLTEKLQERELLQATGKEPGSAIEGQLSPPSMAMLATQQQTGGDRQSTGSRGSAVVDGLIEGGAGSFLGHVGRGAASEEDAGTSDDGCSYLPGDILEDAAHADNWWAWN